MDFLLVLAVIIAVLFFLIFLGTYQDLANRTGIPISSRRELLVPPIAYAVSILSAFLPLFFVFLYPLFQMDIAVSFNFVIPVCLFIFSVLVMIGALVLWLFYSRKEPLGRCFLLSARLMLVPVIDAFWSSVAVYVAFMYASTALLISFLVHGYLIISQQDWLHSIQYIFSSESGLLMASVILMLGLIMAYFIAKYGPSEVLSKYYLLVGYVVLVSCLALAAYLYFSFGSNLLLVDFALIIIGLVICAIYQGVSTLYHVLHVTGVFGLELIIFSVFLLFAAYESKSIINLPIVGELIYDLIPSFVWTISYEVGILGLISGIVIILVARKQPEKGQVMTQAMSIAIGTSAFLPLVFWISPLSNLELISSLLGALFVFVLVAPVYLFAVNILRVRGAIKTLLNPPVFGKRCFNCGHLNNPKAKFCGKCGRRL
jgi:hypothetical protein